MAAAPPGLKRTTFRAASGSWRSPPRSAFTPNLVPRELYPNAFSMQSIAFNTGSIIGPGLSGVVIASLGLQWVYFINAISYLALLGAIVYIGPVQQETHNLGRGVVASLRAIGDGVHFIRRSPVILSSMVLDFIATFFSSAATLLPFVAVDILRVGELEYGWLAAGESIGALVKAGAPYFGRESELPQHVAEPLVPAGKVEIGPAKVEEILPTADAPPPVPPKR